MMINYIQYTTGIKKEDVMRVVERDAPLDRYDKIEAIRESAEKVFKILNENNLFVKDFSGLFKFFGGRNIREIFSGADINEIKHFAWHIKEGEWHWWNQSSYYTGPKMFVNPGENKITFIIFPDSSLLPKIRDVAEFIQKRT
ncbi:hypothetical protein KKG51_05255, partial [Patescibacteria group bacterium]|nr:hypothetical protein [Patescibacteria group bacterium]